MLREKEGRSAFSVGADVLTLWCELYERNRIADLMREPRTSMIRRSLLKSRCVSSSWYLSREEPAGQSCRLYLSPTQTYVFRIDADGIQNVSQHSTARGVSIGDHVSKVGINIATEDSLVHKQREKRRDELIRFEGAFHFDPARSDADFETLRELVLTK